MLSNLHLCTEKKNQQRKRMNESNSVFVYSGAFNDIVMQMQTKPHHNDANVKIMCFRRRTLY